MRRPGLILACFAPAVVWARRSISGQSWAPPRETNAVELHQAQVAMGWSPRPTEAPGGLLGRMLAPRIDDFTLGPKTCGFQSDGISVTCIEDGATCTYQTSHIGCCKPNEACNSVKTTCIDYVASIAGWCNLPDDFHTLCCTNAAFGACFAWVMSTTRADDGVVKTFTAMDCAPIAGTGTLLDYDPAWARTHIFSSTRSSSTTETDPSRPDNPSKNSGDDRGEENSSTSKKDTGSSTNVAAIAGGAAGGGVALILIGVAIFFCLRRKKKNAGTKSPESQGMLPQQMAQISRQDNVSSSAPEVYWPGAPAGHESYLHPSQPNYDPHVSMYSQQGYNQQHATHSVYGPYPQQTSPVSYHSPSTGSPHPHQTPSPGVGDVSPTQANVNELQAVNAVGHETNRAELGGPQ